MIASMVYGSIVLFGGFKKAPKGVNIVAALLLLVSLFWFRWITMRIDDVKSVRASMYRAQANVTACAEDKYMSSTKFVDCMIDWLGSFYTAQDELYKALYE